MAFQFPDLPYAYDALQPYTSPETLQYHHDKHHFTYFENMTKLLPGSGLEGKSLEEVIKESFGKNTPLFNNSAPALQPLGILEVDEEGRRRQQASGRGAGQDR